MRRARWNLLAQALMRSRMVEVVNVLLENSKQVSFTEDQHVVEALAPDTPEKAFAHSVCSGRFHGRSQDPQTSAVSDPIKRPPELVVVVPDEKARTRACAYK